MPSDLCNIMMKFTCWNLSWQDDVKLNIFPRLYSHLSLKANFFYFILTNHSFQGSFVLHAILCLWWQVSTLLHNIKLGSHILLKTPSWVSDWRLWTARLTKSCSQWSVRIAFHVFPLSFMFDTSHGTLTWVIQDPELKLYGGIWNTAFNTSYLYDWLHTSQSSYLQNQPIYRIFQDKGNGIVVIVQIFSKIYYSPFRFSLSAGFICIGCCICKEKQVTLIFTCRKHQ